MIIIAHRCHIAGPDADRANTIKALYDCRCQGVVDGQSVGFDVECDIRLRNGKLLLGYLYPDPKEEIKATELSNPHIWFHAKDVQTFHHLLGIGVKNVYFHQEDDCALTSSGYLWTHRPVAEMLTTKSILVYKGSVPTPEILSLPIYGICTDYPLETAALLRELKQSDGN